MIVFFTTVLTIYALVNIYIFFKGYRALPLLQENRLTYALVFFILGAVFIAAKFLEVEAFFSYHRHIEYNRGFLARIHALRFSVLPRF